MKDKKSKRRWVVYYTKHNHEKKIEALIKEANIEVYLPLITRRNKWSDRIKTISIPMFKSYIFARVDEKERLKILEVEGILRNIAFNGRIAEVPENQIETIKKVAKYKADAISITSEGIIGKSVKVISGPMEGARGIVDYSTDGGFIYFDIVGTGKSIKVKLQVDDVIVEEDFVS